MNRKIHAIARRGTVDSRSPKEQTIQGHRDLANSGGHLSLYQVDKSGTLCRRHSKIRVINLPQLSMRSSSGELKRHLHKVRDKMEFRSFRPHSAPDWLIWSSALCCNTFVDSKCHLTHSPILRLPS